MKLANSTNRTLTEVATDFLNFLNHAGEAPDPNLENEVSKLCDRVCTKIVNGDIIFSTSDLFASQLRKAHETFGKWKINQNRRIVPSESERAVTIAYVAETEKKGNLLAMAILKVPLNRITEIYELYIENPKVYEI